MSIIRIVHNKDNPFVQLNKKALWNPKLSLQATGLWARCMSRPDNWKFKVSELIKSGKEKKTVIYRVISELIEHNYAMRLDFYQKGSNGKFCNNIVEYIFFEFPPTDEEKEDYREEFKKSFLNSDFRDPDKQPLIIYNKSTSNEVDISNHQKDPPMEKEKKDGGGFEKKEEEPEDVREPDVTAFTPSGKKITMSQSAIYRHFTRLPYDTKILQEAIKILRDEKAPITDILKYLEAICKRLESKPLKYKQTQKPKVTCSSGPPKCLAPGVRFFTPEVIKKLKEK